MATPQAATVAALLGGLALALCGCGRPETPAHGKRPEATQQGPAAAPLRGIPPGSEPPTAKVLAALCDTPQAAQFQSLAKATIAAIDSGRRGEVVARITALEGAWDAKEDALRTKSPTTWRVLDETLDRAIAALRGSRTDVPRGRAALERLVAELGQATVGNAPAPRATPAASVAPAFTAVTPARVYAAVETAPFATLTRATIQLLADGNVPGAIAKLTDLEATWDGRGSVLQPRAPFTWTLLDHTLDRAIGALRSTNSEDVPAGKVALEDLVAKLDQATTVAGPASVGPLRVRTAFLLGGEDHWDALTVDSAARRVYLSNSKRVVVLNADTGQVLGEVTDTPHVHGIAIVPDLHVGFTSNGGDGTVSVFDLGSFETLRRIPAGESPDAILYDPASKRVYAFNGRSGDATIIDPARTDKAPETLTIGGKLEFGVADGRGRVYVNVEDRSEVAVIDTKSQKVVARWPIVPGAEPTGVAIDLARHRLFVGCHNQKMVVLDVRTGKVVAEVAVGAGVDGAAFDAGLVLIPNGRDGTLSVTREGPDGTLSAVQTLETARGARTIAADPTTHRFFLPCALPDKRRASYVRSLGSRHGPVEGCPRTGGDIA